MSKNYFELEGRLESDPKVEYRDKYTITTFNLAELKGIKKDGQPITVHHTLNGISKSGESFGNFTQGMEIKIKGIIEAREYNGKTYPSLKIKEVVPLIEEKEPF